jgi:hypothetical protein
VLALLAINAAAAVAFALVYAAAGTRLLTQGAFWAALVVLFVAVTAVWVRVERRQGPGRDVLRRAGRIVAGAAVAAIAVPGLVLTPLFFVHELLPREAGVADVIGPVMFLLLAALVLMILANVAGILFMATAVLYGRLRAARSGPLE